MPRVDVAQKYLWIARQERAQRIVTLRDAGVEWQDIANLEHVSERRVRQIYQAADRSLFPDKHQQKE